MSNLLFPSCRRLLWLLATVTLAVFPALGADTLAGLRQDVAGNPSQAPGAVVRLIRSPESAKPRWAARVTVAALQGLGAQGTARQTSAIVYAAVRAAPDHVLEIVHAATLASPNDQAQHIAAAATAALPHPWQKVKYRRDATALEEYQREVDAKDHTDSKGSAIPPGEKLLSLPEAIAESIVDSREGVSFVAVMAAIDATLVGDPSFLLGAVNNPVILAAFGDSGLSNFGNEPLMHAVLAPLPPTPPPVSP